MNFDKLLRNATTNNKLDFQRQSKKDVIIALEHLSLTLDSGVMDSSTINNGFLLIADVYNHVDSSMRYFIYKIIKTHKELIWNNALSSSEILRRFSFILNSGMNEAKILTMLILEGLDKLFTNDELYIYHYILDLICKDQENKRKVNQHGGGK